MLEDIFLRFRILVLRRQTFRLVALVYIFAGDGEELHYGEEVKSVSATKTTRDFKNKHG